MCFRFRQHFLTHRCLNRYEKNKFWQAIACNCSCLGVKRQVEFNPPQREACWLRSEKQDHTGQLGSSPSPSLCLITSPWRGEGTGGPCLVQKYSAETLIGQSPRGWLGCLTVLLTSQEGIFTG